MKLNQGICDRESDSQSHDDTKDVEVTPIGVGGVQERTMREMKGKGNL